MERLRHEIIEEFFFETSIWDDEGHIIPAPGAAVDKYEELKAGWMVNAPKSNTETPSVALYPVSEEGKQGYIVATQIIYKPPTIPEEN